MSTSTFKKSTAFKATYFVFVFVFRSRQWHESKALHKTKVAWFLTACFSLEENQNKNICLVNNFYISTTNWNFARFSSACLARRKVREISICFRNYSQGSCYYFGLPLKTKYFDTNSLKISHPCSVRFFDTL